MPLAHRNTDPRICDAKTVVQGQGTVFCNGLLWAVSGDPNTHGSGNLIPTGSTVYCEGILVIVHTPDHAIPDDECLLLGPPHCDPMTAGGSPNVTAY